MNNINNKNFTIPIIANCSRHLSTLNFIKEKPIKNLSDHACYEPDLFWRSKCARQGGRCLDDRCTIDNPSRFK